MQYTLVRRMGKVIWYTEYEKPICVEIRRRVRRSVPLFYENHQRSQLTKVNSLDSFSESRVSHYHLEYKIHNARS